MRMAPLTTAPKVAILAAPRRVRAEAPAAAASMPTARADRPAPMADAIEGTSLTRRARTKRTKGDATTCQSYRKGKHGEKECADPKKKKSKGRTRTKIASVRV